MMGAGKSTVGPALATRLGREFLDTDQEVERISGQSIADIFETHGEAHFRALETEAIDQASEQGAVVIALGGGAIVQNGAAEKLAQLGEVIFLNADPKVLVDRIGDGSTRPLLSGLDHEGQVARLKALLTERSRYYEQASVTVDASRTAEEVVGEIVGALRTK